MRRISSVFLLLAGCFPMFASQPLTLDDIFVSNQLEGKTVTDVMWLPDSSAFTFTRTNPRTGESDIYRHDVADGKESLVLAGDKLALRGRKVSMSAYQTTGSQDHLLITGPRRQIWRHSFAAPFYLYDMRNKSLNALAGEDTGLQNTALSPDGKWVAYARESNLYVADVETGKATQLTTDGSENILNGLFDWVYEEEFGRPDAFAWSPDSRHIAFWRFDQTRVKTFPMLDESGVYSEVTELIYPKAGEQNAIVSIGVVNIRSGNVVWQDIGKNDDIYIPRIHWSNDPGQLILQRLNRLQNHLELLSSDIATGNSRVILEDKDPAWIDITDDFIFLSRTDQFLWTTEKSGFRHIYLSDYQGREIRQLTRGSWEVRSVVAIDEQAGTVTFTAAKASSRECGLYRVSLMGGDIQLISRSGGWHGAVFAPDRKHYVGFSSSISQPTQVDLRKSDGSLVRVLEENRIPALEKFTMVYPEFKTLKTSDGSELSAYMMKPADFDPNKKYPVIVYGYGGPGSQMVIDRWGTGSRFRHLQRQLWHQHMVEQGYLVYCVDNRGTGGKGKVFKNLAYGDLSKWAVHDQIEGAKYLASLPYVDANRIGFWGWSGGGYLAGMIMTRASQHFKVGVSVAPVTDFRNYDTIWTERYMGLPADNKKGYDAANVLEYAADLGGMLLVIHGSGDDNVHPNNTMQLVDALIAANKQFDMMIYPNRNHRIHGGNTKHHLFTLITNYFLQHL